MKKFKNFIQQMGSARGHLATATICIALGIASVMIIINSITEYTRAASPESNVERIMCSSRMMSTTKGTENRTIGPIGMPFAEDYLSKVKTPEKVALYTSNTFPRIYGTRTITFTAICCDASYWNIFDFRFKEGRPFTSQEFLGKVNVAVVSTSFFRQLNEMEKKQRSFSFLGKAYAIIGVVDDVCSQRTFTTANIWIPYSTQYEPNDQDGLFNVVYLLKSKDDRDKLRAEIKGIERRYNSASCNPDSIKGFEPRTKLGMLIKGYDISDNEMENSFFLRWLSIIAVILLVPILNLTILNYSHIKDRYAEMGIRKSYGSTKNKITLYFLKENTIVVLLGGTIGYGLSFLFGVIHHINLFDSERFADVPLDSVVHPNLLSFAAVLGISLMISLLSGLFPAWKLAKMNISTALKGGVQ